MKEYGVTKLKRLEEKGLKILRDTFEMILGENVPEDANVVSGSFVITIKDVETETSTFKARFVVHVNKYLEKNRLINNSNYGSSEFCKTACSTHCNNGIRRVDRRHIKSLFTVRERTTS